MFVFGAINKVTGTGGYYLFQEGLGVQTLSYTLYTKFITYALKPFFGMVAYLEVGWTEEDTSKTNCTLKDLIMWLKKE